MLHVRPAEWAWLVEVDTFKCVSLLGDMNRTMETTKVFLTIEEWWES